MYGDVHDAPLSIQCAVASPDTRCFRVDAEGFTDYVLVNVGRHGRAVLAMGDRVPRAPRLGSRPGRRTREAAVARRDRMRGTRARSIVSLRQGHRRTRAVAAFENRLMSELQLRDLPAPEAVSARPGRRLVPLSGLRRSAADERRLDDLHVVLRGLLASRWHLRLPLPPSRLLFQSGAARRDGRPGERGARDAVGRNRPAFPPPYPQSVALGSTTSR